MKKAWLLVMLMMFTAFLPGCQNETQNPPDNQLKKVTLLLDWVPNTNHTGLYAARDKGYYEAEGLDVEIMQPAEGGTAQFIAAEQGDFGVSYQEEVTVARSQDIPVVAIAAVIQHNTSGFASPADRNILTPADFEGKTYGGWGSPAETAMLKAVMQKYNADFDKVNMINIGAADFFTSVEKDIDFSWIFWGWTGIEAQLKDIKLNFIRLNEEDPRLDFYTPVLITSQSKIDEDPELVRKFLRATTKGYQFAIQNPAEAAAILIKAVPDINAPLVEASQEYLAAEYQADAARWGEMDTAVWNNYADFMYAQKLIDKNIDPAKAFTNDFLP